MKEKKTKVKKPFYKKWWVWLLAVIIIGAIATSGEDSDQDTSTADKKTNEEVASTNDSEKAEKGEAAETKEEATEKEETKEEEVVEEKEDSVPREHASALKKAEQYAETMHMSKAGIYDQLTSEYGENFPAEAAQYAIDNIEFDWKANALAKANDYAETMDMSNSAIYDQLVSEYGEKFTAEEAQYAVDNLK